jgi:iron complex outermembrane receptor protein
MFTNSKLAKSVRLAIAFGAAATALPATQAFAADDEVEEIEKIEVTGSRIKRTDMEGVVPVTVISREDLEVSGEISVADVLRDSTFNSFGSSAESSGQGGGTQGIASVSLRGLGADRSLLLINGKRIAPSPAAGGGSANLNAIPFAAVDRIEIVSNGASAVYGSDAIGGVVNVILRKDYEGVSVSGSMARPTQEGGDENSFGVVMGLSGDKGSFVMSVEHSDREIIYSRDREYTRSSIGETWEDNFNISSYGRNIKYYLDSDNDGSWDTIEYRAVESECDTSLDLAGVQTKSGSQPGTMCGYNYSNIMAQTTSLANTSMYTRGVYEISNDLSFNLNSLATRFISKGRFAPAAGAFNIPGTDLANDNMADTDYTDDQIIWAQAFWRFTDNGPRDSQTEGYNFDVNAYLEGGEDWGAWEVGVHRNVATITELGNGYINQKFAEQFGAEGTLSDPDSVALMAHTISTYNKTDYTAINAGISLDSIFSLPAGDVGAYFYTEYVETSYVSDSDALSDAVAVIGSAGGSAKGTREILSVATEFLVPVMDGMELTLAARYDDYSDFGSNLSPQVGLSYKITDDYSVRTTWGQGFRAPTFSDLFTVTQGFPWVYVSGVGWAQYETMTMGNENLDAEKSDQFAIGFVGQIMDGLDFTIDYQTIKITNMISYESASSIWWKHENGVALKDGTSVVVESGLPKEFVASYINEGEMRASFLDLNVNATQETSFGTFRQNLQLSYVASYETLEETEDANGNTREVFLNAAGIDGLPEYRANINLAWENEDHSLNVLFKYIPSQMNTYELNDNGTEYVYKENDSAVTGLETDIASYTDIDVNYTYQVMDALSISVGGRNLTNEDPRFGDVNETDYDGSLYSIQGRTYYASFKYDF